MNKTNPMNMSPNDYLEIIKKKDADRVSDGTTYYVTSDGTIFLEEDQALEYEIAWLKGE